MEASERRPDRCAARLVRWLGWAVIFCVVFTAAGAGVGAATAVAVKPMISREAWLIGGAGLLSRSDLDVRFIANLAWMFAVHPGAVAAGLLGALSAPRLGWWRVVLAGAVALYFMSLQWHVAARSLEVLAGIPADDTLASVLHRQVAGAMALAALSMAAALPGCIAATSLGCLWRPRPTDE